MQELEERIIALAVGREPGLRKAILELIQYVEVERSAAYQKGFAQGRKIQARIDKEVNGMSNAVFIANPVNGNAQ